MSNSEAKRFFITTFGCQMNVHDSERLAGMLRAAGYVSAPSQQEADVVVFNTCCIRENAENKVYGNLGLLKRQKEENPRLKIAVGGCMPQQKQTLEKMKKGYRFVDVIFGTHNLHMLPELLEKAYETGKQVSEVWDSHGPNIPDGPHEAVRESKWRSGVNIMYGCDNFCSYCVVPYVRGRERSRSTVDILREIRMLADDGVKEITLLGQNVNSYGQKPESADGMTTFPELLSMINGVDGIERIRFMTSHPKDLSAELIFAIRDLKKVCKHIHLPVQSGSIGILKRMNRKYDREAYLSLVDALRREIPGISITTDIIAGFPGETEKDFKDTLSLVRSVRFNNAFTFLYSKREGTPAAGMDNAVPPEIAALRFNELLKTLNPIIFEINKSMEGKTLKVLAETRQEGVLTGRTDDNSLVHFSGGSDALLGDIVDVRILEGKPFYLMGMLEDEGKNA